MESSIGQIHLRQHQDQGDKQQHDDKECDAP